MIGTGSAFQIMNNEIRLLAQFNNEAFYHQSSNVGTIFWGKCLDHASA